MGHYADLNGNMQVEETKAQIFSGFSWHFNKNGLIRSFLTEDCNIVKQEHH